MNIAVLSGKGGTGKTTVSTNLAVALGANYIDCDVEEPNGFLFMQPEISEAKKVMCQYPVVDQTKCVACGKCAEACQFNALIRILDQIVFFDKLCHSCNACKIACETGAIHYDLRETGSIERGTIHQNICMRGILNIGEPMAGPVIANLLKEVPEGLNILDCSPGTSCNVVKTLNNADAAILVTELSAFGLHDLKMAVSLVKMFHIPLGVIINKDNGKNTLISDYCLKENIPIIGRIPFSKEAAQIYSKGELIYNHLVHKVLFDHLAVRAEEVLKWS